MLKFTLFPALQVASHPRSADCTRRNAAATEKARVEALTPPMPLPMMSDDDAARMAAGHTTL